MVKRMFDKLESVVNRYEQIGMELTRPDIASNNELFRKLMKEHSDLTPIVEKYREYTAAKDAEKDALEILAEPNLDKDFKREKDDVGTDVYVLGFKKPSNWETQIIAKVLDSFMVAIDSGDLEVKVEDKEIINKETLQSFVYDTKFYKVDKAHTREYGGNGIGLNINNRRMCEINHAEIILGHTHTLCYKHS